MGWSVMSDEKTIEDGGAAFPYRVRSTITSSDGIPRSYMVEECEAGLSLRDYFAAAAMQGMVSSSLNVANDEALAKYSYALADEMIKARKAQ